MAKIKKHELSFGGKMELVEIEVDDFPKEILKADDWFGPQVGELCFINGKIDVVKTLSWGDTHGGIFKPHMMVTFENCDTKINYSAVTRIEVKKGKVFIFNGKPFVHQEALDGGYIEKMARGNEITEYEYKFGE